MAFINRRFRDRFLNLELFPSVQLAKVEVERHRVEYNNYRLHSALRERTPL